MLTTSKRSNSARLPQFLHLTSNTARLPHFWKLATSKTNNSMRLPFNNEKLSAELTASCQRVLRFFQSVSLKHRLPRKREARSYKVLDLSRKIILANLKISCSKMQPLWGNQRPDLRTSLMNMSLVLRLPRKLHLISLRILFKCPTPANAFGQVQNPLHLPRETTSKRPKMLRSPQFIHFWLPSRHNGVHFFDISTSKSGPRPSVFNTFDFEMCFAPQWHALFRYLNF